MIWFTSDLHIGHQNILNWADKRKHWKNLDEMDEGLVEMWNSCVSKDDLVYNLGDLAFATSLRFNQTSKVLMALNGEHVLVLGNHDSVGKIRRFPNQPETCDLANLTIQGITFNLRHFPYFSGMKEEDKTERPNHFTRQDNPVTPLIHGHVHDRYKLSMNSINVGFDAWGRMLSEDDIVKIYKYTNGFTENLEHYNEI